MWRWIGGLLLVGALAVGGLVYYRAQQFAPPATAAAAAIAAAPDIGVTPEAAAAHLAEAVRFKTVSVQAGQAWDEAPFAAQRAWIETTYPAFHRAASREIINKESLLYTWKGTDETLAPMLLLAHLDVVPVEEWSRKDWKADPFAGEIRDGFVWGRGSFDDKGSLIGILESANALAASGFKPRRTILVAFGHDEEVSGRDGAIAIAAVLKQRGVKAWFAIDEGMAVAARFPLTGGAVGLIGIAEKGYATMRVIATSAAGHSSTPSEDTAVTLLSEAILRIHRMPVTMKLEGGPGLGLMQALAPRLPQTVRIAVANEWLFSPLINQEIGRDPRAAALLRTTIAPTMLEASPKENVLPGRATAMINFRLHPRDSSASIMAAAQNAVHGVPGITLEWAAPPNEPTAVSSTTSDSYALIASVARTVGEGAPVAPTLVLAGTDSRHYSEVAENIYRFTPVLATDEEVAGVHNVNEKLSVANVGRMVRGYAQLIVAGAGPAPQ